MELHGKNNLLCDNYDYITFCEFCEYFTCRIVSKNKSTNEKNLDLKKELESCKEDSEYFLKIVNHYLSTNKIDSIKQGISLRNYCFTFTQVTSGNRRLNFQLNSNSNNVQKALKNILSKFQEDRNDILYENLDNCNQVFIIPDYIESSIGVEDDSIIIKYISNKREDIIEYDQNFIVSFLINYIDYSNKVEYEIETNNDKKSGISLNICEKKIIIENSRIIDSLISYVDEHNKQMEENKELKKQWRKYNGNNNGKIS